MENQEEEIPRKNSYWNEKEKWHWTTNLFLGCTLLYATRNAMAVCVPAIAKELAWNKELSGTALSSFFIGYVGSNIFGGHFADRFGGAKTILYSSVIWSILTLMLPLFANSSINIHTPNTDIFILRFLTGCSQGFFFPSFISLISNSVRVEEKGFIVGICYSGCAVGIIATGFFGSILIEVCHWSYVFIITGLLSLLWLVWFRSLYLTTLISSSNEIAFKVPSQKIGFLPFLKKILRYSSIWAILISYFGSGATYTVLNSWAPVYFHDMFPDSKGWVFNVIPWVTSFAFEIATGYFANKMLKNGRSLLNVRKSYAALLFSGTALFSILLTKVSSFDQALLLMSLIAGFSAFASSSLSMNPQDVCPSQSGSLFGLANAVGSIGGTIGVYMTGHILEKGKENWSTIFICNALMSVLSCFVFMIFGSTKQIF